MKRNLLKHTWLAAALAMAAPCLAQGLAGGGGGASGEGSSGAFGVAVSFSGDGADPNNASGAGAPDGAAGGAMSGSGDAQLSGLAIDFSMPLNPQGLPATLDQAIQRALANNPDIRVAEANLRQAQATYEQAKLKLTHQVMIAMEQAEVDRLAWERMQELVKSNVVSQQDQHLARLAARKSQLELQYLLGEAPAGMGMTSGMPGMGGGFGAMGMGGGSGQMLVGGSGGPSGVGLNIGSMSGGTGSAAVGGGLEINVPAGGGGAGMMEGGGASGDAAGERGEGGGSDIIPPRSSMRKRIEEQLAADCGPVDFRDRSLNLLSQELSAKLQVPVIVDNRAIVERSGDSIKVNMMMNRDALTWRDVLMAIADTHDIAFVIRDYGILITTPEKANAANLGGGLGGGGLGGGGGGFGGGGF